MKTEVRIDKWLWAVRLFKTRTIAAEACKKGKVLMGGIAVKPSRMLKTGDVVQIRRSPIVYSFQALALTENRVGAKLAPAYRRDVTAPDQLELLEMSRLNGFIDRARGTGRPTKKDRRELDDFTDNEDSDDWDWDFEEE